MSVIRSEDFEPRRPEWVSDPHFDDLLKKELIARGMAEPLSGVECVELEDDCWYCRQKLTTPYVYWNNERSLSLHAACAARLAAGLAQDAQEILSGGRGDGKVSGAKWLARHFGG